MGKFSHIFTRVSRSGFITVDVKTDFEALRLARTIVAETGYALIVSDEERIEIARIPAPPKN